MPRIPFGPWLPDATDVGHAGLEEALNCFPRADGYEAMPDVQTFGTSVTASVMLSGYSTRDLSANGYTFAGSNDHLYKQSSTGAWDGVNRTASYGAGIFRFATFGNTLLAVNGVDALQVYTLGTSSQFLNASASASAPVAAHIAVVRDFVFLGRLSSFFNRIQWSHINNPLRYGRSQPNQSDLQDLPGDGGNVVGITGGDFALVLTDRSIHRFSYVGAPLVFRRDEIAPNTGCIAPGSIARYQNLTFFLSGNGFMVCDGAQAISIGDEQVDDWFFDNADSGSYDRMTAAIDPDRKLYVLSFTSVAATDGTPDKLLIYNFESKRWTNASETLDCLFSGIARGAFTLEQLDAFGTLETLPHSLDSDQWGGSKQNVLAGFSGGHIFQTFNATTAKAATLITGEGQLHDGYRSLVTELRPLVQGNSATTITARLGMRNRLIDSVSFGAAAALNSIGLCPVRGNARFHRVRVDVSGGFDRMHAFDLRAVRDGMR